jgi:modification methylase
MALPLDESTVKTMMAPKAATRVAFGTLVEGGMIAPGSVLTDAKRRWKAVVRVDGSLDCAGQDAGSIHKVGAGVQGAPSCNGWTFWHIDDGKQLRVIDAVRQDWLLANEA